MQDPCARRRCRHTTPASASRRTRRNSRPARDGGPPAVRATSRPRHFTLMCEATGTLGQVVDSLDFDAMAGCWDRRSTRAGWSHRVFGGPRLHRGRHGPGGAARPAVWTGRRCPVVVRSADLHLAHRRGFDRCGGRGCRTRLGHARPDRRRSGYASVESSRRRQPDDLGGDEAADWAATPRMVSCGSSARRSPGWPRRIRR